MSPNVESMKNLSDFGHHELLEEVLLNLLDSGFLLSFNSGFLELLDPELEGFISSLGGAFDKLLSGLNLDGSTLNLNLFEEISHISLHEDSGVEVEHEGHSLDSGVNVSLSSFDLAEESVEGAGLVDVGVENEVVCGSLEEVLSGSGGDHVPSPEGSLEVETRILLETHQHLALELQIRGDLLGEGVGAAELDDEGTESRLLSLSDLVVDHDGHAQQEVLQDEGINFAGFRGVLGAYDAIESGNVFSDQFPLEDPGDFGGSFEFSELVFVDLGSDSLQKLLLLPTLVFNFLFDKFDKFLAVSGVGCNDLELSGLFLGKGFRGGGDALGEGGDFFENSVLKVLLLLVLDEFDLSLEEADVLLIPLKGAEDVLVKFVG